MLIDLCTSSMGQASKLTPMQMVSGIAAAVNGGYLVEPHVVDKIISNDGNIVKSYDTNIKRQVISEETSAVMRKLLQAVIDDKEGSNAHIDGYAIGGKSGTAQKLDEYRTAETMQYVASYTCFAPADDPEFVILVMADEPNKNINYYGSVVAAPYARNIMQDALDHLGYYPEYTAEQYAKLDVPIPRLIDADVEIAQKTIEEDLHLECEIVGEGKTVVGQSPMTSTTVSSSGKVILYTEEGYAPKIVTVPDLTGYTAHDATQALKNLDLNYVTVGASEDRTDALVEQQSVEPGTEVEVGTVVKLTYLVNDQTG